MIDYKYKTTDKTMNNEPATKDNVGFLAFPVESLVASWNPKNLPAALLPQNNHLVQYQSNSIITRIVS
jgi:hypothetical protein